ncbi:3962_t:CDS:2 [Entrophospora sp. SA101]|nr:3962_t:CDS:2 [Entrophospora sp. SA101]
MKLEKLIDTLSERSSLGKYIVERLAANVIFPSLFTYPSCWIPSSSVGSTFTIAISSLLNVLIEITCDLKIYISSKI